MTLRQQRILAIVLLAFVGVAALLVFGAKRMFKRHEEAIACELAFDAMMGQLRVGDSPARVQQVFFQHRTNGIRLIEHNSNAWVIEMPRDLAVTPANLYVDFSAEQVSRLRIRFQHDTNVQPYQTENDKQ
jgi:hypothetical protein